jgi:hypothetical protein
VMLTLSWDLNGPILENCQVSIVLWVKRNWNPLFTEGRWQMELFCVMTTRLRSYGSSDRWNDSKAEDRASPPPRILPHLILSDRSEMRYVDADLQTMKRSRTRCTRGLPCSRKHLPHMTSESSWTEVRDAWRS